MVGNKRFYLGIKALIRNDVGEFLLVQKNPDGIRNLDMDNSQDYWDFPGGRIQWGETISDVLKRELEEEIGLKYFETRGLFHATISNIDDRSGEGGLALFIYECVVDKGFEPVMNDENIRFKWFNNIEAADKLKVNYPDDLIQKLFD